MKAADFLGKISEVILGLSREEKQAFHTCRCSLKEMSKEARKSLISITEQDIRNNLEKNMKMFQEFSEGQKGVEQGSSVKRKMERNQSDLKIVKAIKSHFKTKLE